MSWSRSAMGVVPGSMRYSPALILPEHAARCQILCHPVEARARQEHVVEAIRGHGQRLVERPALLADVEPGAERRHDERDAEARDDAYQPAPSQFRTIVGFSH
jgi:hypothetical protein